MKAMEGIYRECGVEIVNLINKKYNMDVKYEELLSSSSSSEERLEKVVLESSSISFPIPFNKNNVKAELCQGLCYNHGLFTQCPKKRVTDSCEFCKGCSKEGEKSKTGKPNCGTIEARLATGLMEYTDSKGRKPIAYRKVLDKLSISMETVKEMASKENIVIDSIHFEETEQKRGRPKTKITKKVEAATVEDLFATLVNEELENVESINSTVVMSASDEEELKEKEAKLAADKEAKEAKLAADKEAKLKEKETKLAADKAAKEAKLAAEKEAKESKLAAEKEAKEAKLKEKEAKLAADKAAKEAKLAAEKETKEAKLAAKEAPKEKVQKEKVQKEKVVKEKVQKEKVVKESKKEEVQKEKVVKESKKEETKEVEETPTKVSVKRITIDGKEYFKTSANILYDPETKEEVGLYDAETNSIKELPDDSDNELQEDEYDSDN